MALLALASLAIPDLARPGAPPHLAALYQAIGAQRSMAGLQPLAPSPDLELLAAAWSQHIAAKGKLIHRDDLRHIMLERGSNPSSATKDPALARFPGILVTRRVMKSAAYPINDGIFFP